MQRLILERLIACYSVALDGGNKRKLEALYRLLMERIQQLSPDEDGLREGGVERVKLNHDELDAVGWGLYHLTQQMPAFAKSEWRAFLAGLQVCLCVSVRVSCVGGVRVVVS